MSNTSMLENQAGATYELAKEILDKLREGNQTPTSNICSDINSQQCINYCSTASNNDAICRNVCNTNPNTQACYNFCRNNPFDSSCPCIINPNGQNCRNYCLNNPNDPNCQVTPINTCINDPLSQQCLTYCRSINYNDSNCADRCRNNPNDTSCPCIIDPNSQNCRNYCRFNPNDLNCQNISVNPCVNDPFSQQCLTYCRSVNYNDSSCTNRCRNNPNDSTCPCIIDPNSLNCRNYCRLNPNDLNCSGLNPVTGCDICNYNFSVYRNNMPETIPGFLRSLCKYRADNDPLYREWIVSGLAWWFGYYVPSDPVTSDNWEKEQNRPLPKWWWRYPEIPDPSEEWISKGNRRWTHLPPDIIGMPKRVILYEDQKSGNAPVFIPSSSSSISAPGGGYIYI